MPGKSRHGKRKHYQQSKKSRAGQQHTAMVSQPLSVAGTPQPVAALSATPPSTRVPAPITTPGVAQYTYITTELRNIGILAGIILIILIVLARVLS